MSAAGGLPRAVERAVVVGCATLQVFTKNSNQWAGKPLGADEAEAFQVAAAKAGISPLAAHSAYLINLGSPDPGIRERSVLALADEIDRCDRLGIPFLVLHPGSHGGDGEETGLDRVARGLDAAAVRTPGSRTLVLLESAAGQGFCLGHTFEHLREILRRSDSRDRLAICMDTCHLHAAGHDLVSLEGWRRMMNALDENLGLESVKVIHANDSRKERGCRVDRHERIGLGFLGESAFTNLMTEPAFEHIPKILETPKDETGEWDRLGLAVLRRLAKGTGQKAPARTATAEIPRPPGSPASSTSSRRSRPRSPGKKPPARRSSP